MLMITKNKINRIKNNSNISASNYEINLNIMMLFLRIHCKISKLSNQVPIHWMSTNQKLTKI